MFVYCRKVLHKHDVMSTVHGLTAHQLLTISKSSSVHVRCVYEKIIE